MRKIRSRQTNHLISVLSIAIFCLSIFCLVVFGIVFVKQIQDNQRLQDEYQQVKEEYDNLQEIYTNTDEDGCYHVYSDGEMVIYDVGGTIIIK